MKKTPAAWSIFSTWRVPYFGLIFIGFACGKAKGLPEAGPGVDEFLPAVRFAAGAAVRDHVEDAVRANSTTRRS